MVKKIANLGSKENEFLSTLAGSGKNIFTFRDTAKYWGSLHNARIAIHRLVQKGWLKQIEKWKYLIVPLEAGKERQWSEYPYIVASELVSPAAVSYWSAIRHWNCLIPTSLILVH